MTKDKVSRNRRLEGVGTLRLNSDIAGLMKQVARIQKQFGDNDALLEASSVNKRMREMLGANGAQLEAVKAVSRLQEIFSVNSAQLEAAKAVERMQEMFSANSAQLEAAKAVKRMQKMFGANSAQLEATRTAKHMQEMLGANSAIAEAMKSSHEALSTFALSLEVLAVPANLSAAIGVIENELALEDYESVIAQKEINDGDIDASLHSLSEVRDSESLSDIFYRIPVVLQVILIFVVLQIIMPQLNSISANLLTPYVDEFISDIADRDKVRALKKIDLSELDVPLNDLRFVSRENVRLRAGPSIKTKQIDALRLGQVVVFIEKSRNWTKVLIQYDEGEDVYGWVFSRYLEKFKN